MWVYNTKICIGQQGINYRLDSQRRTVAFKKPQETHCIDFEGSDPRLRVVDI
jgi:hypothetical protein